jgi:hypothetical protein
MSMTKKTTATDKAYLEYIRQQRCAGCLRPPPNHAHHHTRGVERKRGKGQKADDRETIPLCYRCHHDFHATAGAFKVWDKQWKRDWQDAMVRHYQSRYDDAF